MRRTRMNLVVVAMLAALLACVRAAGSEQDDLVKRAKEADLVVLGQVIRVTEGKEDADLAKMNVRFRTDIAVVAVIEVLKGDPKLKKVEVGFPGFPKAGEFGFKTGQNGIWLLTKSDQKFYEAKRTDQLLPQDKLGAIRRAVRTAMGLNTPVEEPADRAARIAKLAADVLSKGPDATRRLAAYQLGEAGELRTAPTLIDALDDAAPSVRLAADIALRKITGHRAQVDFRNGTPKVRAQGAAAWRQWWEANKDRRRQDLLLAAARVSRQPLPDFQYAVEGLTRYDDAALLPVFRMALDSAISQKRSDLVLAASIYLGRTKHRASIPKLAGILDKTWPTAAARAAAATAIGQIVGKDFGTGPKAVNRCAEWWAANKTTGGR
jgi:hypothetical protein